MTRLRNSASAILALAATLAVPALAEAKCRYDPFRFRLQDEVVTTKGTTDAGGCKMQYRAGSRTTFTESAIAERPKNGTLTKTGGYAYSYKPKAKFSGADSFAIKVCGTNIQGPGCSTVQYNLVVE